MPDGPARFVFLLRTQLALTLLMCGGVGLFPETARAEQGTAEAGHEVAAATARALPADSFPAASAKARLPERFAVRQTDRFILFSDVNESLTSQSGRWVERAHDEFDRFVRECDLQPQPLQHKLVCILFQNPDEYLSFAQVQDGMRNINFTGYYSPRHDRVVFSMGADEGAPSDAAQTSVSGNEKPVLGFDSRGVKSDPNETHDDCNHAELPNQSAAKCVHEVIHQLMFHTRLMKPDVQYPLWVCEGLSTAFETDTPGKAFGPDQEYAPRLQAFRKLMGQNDLIPLRELASLTHLSSRTPWITRAVYQQSYALVTWMCREKRAELREYLRLMQMQSPGKMSATRHLELFEKAFGDVDALEQGWLAYETSEARQAIATR